MPPVRAQNALAENNVPAVLPDAPNPKNPNRAAANAQRESQAPQEPKDRTGHQVPPPISDYAPRLARYIEPGELTRRLSAKEKLELSVHQEFRPYAFSTKFIAAGWEQLLNSNPKYGSDSAGFGERLGAAFIRQDSNALFSDGVFAALLHQDPRFYRKGSGTILSRLGYAATRGIVTRTDAGNPAPNYSRLLGAAASYALTTTYYPAVSATWPQAIQSYGVSFLTGALGFEIHEFGPDLLYRARRWHRH